MQKLYARLIALPLFDPANSSKDREYNNRNDSSTYRKSPLFSSATTSTSGYARLSSTFILSQCPAYPYNRKDNAATVSLFIKHTRLQTAFTVNKLQTESQL